MEIALIQFFPGHGFEVWITDLIEIGVGMGDVFITHCEAMQYARDHSVPIADISFMDMPNIEGEELRYFLAQYLEISQYGEVISIRDNV